MAHIELSGYLIQIRYLKTQSLCYQIASFVATNIPDKITRLRVRMDLQLLDNKGVLANLIECEAYVDSMIYLINQILMIDNYFDVDL